MVIYSLFFCTNCNHVLNTVLFYIICTVFLQDWTMMSYSSTYFLSRSSWDSGLLTTPMTFPLLSAPAAGLFTTLSRSCSSSRSSLLSSIKKKSSLNTWLWQFLMVALSCCCSFPGVRHRFTAQFRVWWSASSHRPSTEITRTLTVERDENVLVEMVCSAKRRTLRWPCKGRMCSLWILSWHCRSSSGKRTGGHKVSELPFKLGGQLGEVVTPPLFHLPLFSQLSVNDGQDIAPLRRPLPDRL